MTLFQREVFEGFVLKLPAVEIVHQWGDASVGKVGGKIFALYSPGGWAGEPAISFKCSDMSYQLLPELDGVGPAPYLARAKWIQARSGCDLSTSELSDYIIEAHRLIVGKLTRRLRRELGLAGPVNQARHNGRLRVSPPDR